MIPSSAVCLERGSPGERGRETPFTAFLDCPSDSIDYAVMEKLPAGEAVAVPLDCGWSDVGAWGALWTVSEKDGDGNVARGTVIIENTRGSLVHADSRLVTVLGADDLVVVETADAVFVAPKDKAGDLKPLVGEDDIVRLEDRYGRLEP